MSHFLKRMSITLAKYHRSSSASHAFFQAAVLVPVVEVNKEYHVLFEVRSSQLTWQPGEICFPGGKIEAADGTPEAAALRETSEELGIDPGAVQVLGMLDDIISPIGVRLFPAVGFVPSGVAMRPNAAEVAETFTVPVEFLLSAEPITATMEMGTRPLADFPFELVPGYSREWKRRGTYNVLFYRYQHYVIWGLTAQVLSSFIKICREI